MKNSSQRSDSQIPIDSQFTHSTIRQVSGKPLSSHQNLEKQMPKLDSVFEPAFGNLFHDIFLGIWTIVLLTNPEFFIKPNNFISIHEFITESAFLIVYLLILGVIGSGSKAGRGSCREACFLISIIFFAHITLFISRLNGEIKLISNVSLCKIFMVFWSNSIALLLSSLINSRKYFVVVNLLVEILFFSFGFLFLCMFDNAPVFDKAIEFSFFGITALAINRYTGLVSVYLLSESYLISDDDNWINQFGVYRIFWVSGYWIAETRAQINLNRTISSNELYISQG